MPKHHRGLYCKCRNWLFVVVCRNTSLVYCQLVCKWTRLALETIIFNCIRPGSHIESGEHKSYYWLGRTTTATKYDRIQTALYTHSTVNHSKTFKDKETGTHTNKVEGQNSALKGPYKRMKGMPKKMIPEYLDQIMFEGWVNSVLPFDLKSHSKAEKDKSFDIWLMLLVSLGELYCNDGAEWYFEKAYVSDGGLIEVCDDLYDYYKDQGYMENENDVPDDDLYELDESEADLGNNAEESDDENSEFEH